MFLQYYNLHCQKIHKSHPKLRMSLYVFPNHHLKSCRIDQEKSGTVSNSSETMNLEKILYLTSSYL